MEEPLVVDGMISCNHDMLDPPHPHSIVSIVLRDPRIPMFLIRVALSAKEEERQSWCGGINLISKGSLSFPYILLASLNKYDRDFSLRFNYSSI